MNCSKLRRENNYHNRTQIHSQGSCPDHAERDVNVKVRLVDCVGFMVDGAAGHMEDDEERLVKTPGLNMRFRSLKAAEIGTKKVINDHSTIGIVVTDRRQLRGTEKRKLHTAGGEDQSRN